MTKYYVADQTPFDITVIEELPHYNMFIELNVSCEGVKMKLTESALTKDEIYALPSFELDSDCLYMLHDVIFEIQHGADGYVGYEESLKRALQLLNNPA